MRPTVLPAALLTLLALTLAACGGGDTAATDDGSTPTAAATSAPAPTSDEPAPASDGPAPTADEPEGDSGTAAAVTIAGFAFDAPSEVPAGTTVRVTNTDGAPHTFTAEDGSFDTGSIGPGGGEATVTIDEPGTYAYMCTIHPSMTGTLTVTE